MVPFRPTLPHQLTGRLEPLIGGTAGGRRSEPRGRRWRQSAAGPPPFPATSPGPGPGNPTPSGRYTLPGMRPPTWARLESRLAAGLRPLGWRRVGAEWRGPCPVTLAGPDAVAWVRQGELGQVRLGCRHCAASGLLDDDELRLHLAALTGQGIRPAKRTWRNYGSTRCLVERFRRAARNPAPLPERGEGDECQSS